jgi:hypothetical protein
MAARRFAGAGVTRGSPAWKRLSKGEIAPSARVSLTEGSSYRLGPFRSKGPFSVRCVRARVRSACSMRQLSIFCA